MILLGILAVIVITLILFFVLLIGTIGGIFIFVFGDVIVCIVLLVLLIRWLIKRRRR